MPRGVPKKPRAKAHSKMTIAEEKIFRVNPENPACPSPPVIAQYVVCVHVHEYHSNKSGTFIADMTQQPYRPMSPVYDLIRELEGWMLEYGWEWDRTLHPYGVRKIPTHFIPDDIQF